MNDDKTVVARVLHGEKEAFAVIIEKYKNPLLNYIGRMVGDREKALDFTQDVFIKSYTSLHTYQPRYKFSTWLYKIASNTVIDYWRKKKIDAISIDARDENRGGASLQVPAPGQLVEQQYELGKVREKIEEILKNIPLRLRELFVWRHVNGLNYEEIAEIKNLPLGTIKNRIFQAKEIIRSELERKK